MSPEVIAEMTGGHDRLLRLALGHTGQLPKPATADGVTLAPDCGLGLAIRQA